MKRASLWHWGLPRALVPDHTLVGLLLCRHLHLCVCRRLLLHFMLWRRLVRQLEDRDLLPLAVLDDRLGALLEQVNGPTTLLYRKLDRREHLREM